MAHNDTEMRQIPMEGIGEGLHDIQHLFIVHVDSETFRQIPKGEEFSHRAGVEYQQRSWIRRPPS